MDSDELIKMLCNRLLESTAANNRVAGHVERAVSANERLARAVEDVANQLNANVPAILSALGIVKEHTGAFLLQKEEGQVVGTLRAFGALPPRAQALLVAAAPLLAFVGWCIRELMMK